MLIDSAPQVTFCPDPATPGLGRVVVYLMHEHGDTRSAAAALGLTHGIPDQVALARPRDGRVTIEDVPVWAVPLRQALPVLVGLPPHGEDAWAREVSASVRLWALAARLAVRLVGSHHLAPTLVCGTEGRVHGVWRALVDHDAEASGLLARLAAAMPRAAHAVVLGEDAVWSPAMLLRAMLDAVADLAARQGAPSPSVGRPRARLLPWTARWAEALADPADSRVPLREDAAELVAGVGGWHAGGHEHGGPGMPELQLVAPDALEGPWRLDFGVRTPDGHLHPAGQVWAAAGDGPESVALQETLLRGLGRCARVFAPIERVLHEAAPEHVHLDLSQAWQLLSETAALLSAVGVVVRLPGDIAYHRIRPRIRIGIPTAGAPTPERVEVTPDLSLLPGIRPRTGQTGAWQGALSGLLTEFRWEIALGDETLTHAEFEALVAAQQPLVRWRDRWVRIDPATVACLGRLGESGQLSLAEALALGLEGDAAAEWYADGVRAETVAGAGVEPIEVVVDGGVALLLDRIRAASDHPPAPKTPEGFEGELRGYQRRGVAWLAGMGQLGLGAVLADDMGLGKCVAPDTRVFVNGALVPAEQLWKRYAGAPASDGTGEWAEPVEELLTDALGPGEQIVPARIARLYRQYVREPLRRVVLEDGSALTLTRRHKLRGRRGWTNEIGPGDRVAVPGRLPQVRWKRVAAVEDVDFEGWVYDFEVPEHHSFVAEGVLCHNTIQLIAHMLERSSGGEVGPFLIVCPTSVVGNWEREVNRFAPGLPVVRHHGPERSRALGQPVGAVLTTYGTLRRDADLLSEISWDVVALDEAQYVKNPTTAAARAVRRLRARQVVALTGTPLENRLAELWSVLDATNPGLLGTRAGFNRRFAAPIERQRDEAAARRLRRLVAPFVLRRSKSDPSVIADLPDKIERTVVCPLTIEQAALYQAAVDRALETLAGVGAMQRRGRILALLTELKQVCNHPAQYLGEPDPVLPGRSGKLAAAQEIVAEATSGGDRLLVFTQFVAMGRLLVAQLGRDLGVDVPFLHGGVTAGGRDRIVERFQSDPAASPVLVVSLRAGGTGLNLTAATHVVHYDRWWNPAVEDQATDRAHRIGQTRTVEVHKLVTAGTLEERIAELLERKRALADAVVGAGEAWVTELDDAALAELVALSEDAQLIDLADDEDLVEAWSGSV
ncbi:MAG: SNF2-related protein [Egibacteraceae bacterium]